MIKDLLLKNRSYRRFRGEVAVDLKVLEELVDLARFCPSAANLQPLRYILSCETKKNALIFPHLKWAGYLKDWPGPKKEERPAAYIIILSDKEIKRAYNCDHGIAAQSILLGAVERGLGGCMIGSIDRNGLRKALNILQRYEIMLVLALGKPNETVILEDVDSSGNIKYWRDEKNRHHVPKRKLAEIIIR